MTLRHPARFVVFGGIVLASTLLATWSPDRASLRRLTRGLLAGTLPLAGRALPEQATTNSCGAYCLAVAGARLGRETAALISPEALATIPPDGYSMRQLALEAQRRGLPLVLVADANRADRGVPRVLLLPRARHFVVVLSSPDLPIVEVYDPRIGRGLALSSRLLAAAAPFGLVPRGDQIAPPPPRLASAAVLHKGERNP